MATNGQPAGFSEPRSLFKWWDAFALFAIAWSVYLAYLGGWWAAFVAVYLVCLAVGVYFKISTALHVGHIEGMRFARGEIQ